VDVGILVWGLVTHGLCRNNVIDLECRRDGAVFKFPAVIGSGGLHYPVIAASTERSERNALHKLYAERVDGCLLPATGGPDLNFFAVSLREGADAVTSDETGLSRETVLKGRRIFLFHYKICTHHPEPSSWRSPLEGKHAIISLLCRGLSLTIIPWKAI
jgi:hypothetical protein